MPRQLTRRPTYTTLATVSNPAYATLTNMVLAQRARRSSQSVARTEYYGLVPFHNPHGLNTRHPTTARGLAHYVTEFLYAHPDPTTTGWYDNRPTALLAQWAEHLPYPYNNTPGLVLPEPYSTPPRAAPAPPQTLPNSPHYVYSHYTHVYIDPNTRRGVGTPALGATFYITDDLIPLPLAGAHAPPFPQPWCLEHLIPRVRHLNIYITQSLQEIVDTITYHFRILRAVGPSRLLANTPQRRLSALLEAIGLRWLMHTDLPTHKQPPIIA